MTELQSYYLDILAVPLPVYYIGPEFLRSRHLTRMVDIAPHGNVSLPSAIHRSTERWNNSRPTMELFCQLRFSSLHILIYFQS